MAERQRRRSGGYARVAKVVGDTPPQRRRQAPVRDEVLDPRHSRVELGGVGVDAGHHRKHTPQDVAEANGTGAHHDEDRNVLRGVGGGDVPEAYRGHGGHGPVEAHGVPRQMSGTHTPQQRSTRGACAATHADKSYHAAGREIKP